MGAFTPFFLALLCCVSVGTTLSRPFYTAAVFEHARFGSANDSAELIVNTNLEYYRKAATIAKSKGADVIVFPEYGIFPPGDRPQLKKYLERCPDPRKEQGVNPCEEAAADYSDRPILRALSCMARNNSMVVVANTGDVQSCTGDDQCPEDGVFHFNTNVVFDRNGTLLVRYHKEHLFFELGMDLAREQQDTTFRTDFGTFATYICFDIDFARMGEVGRTVDAVLFSTMWLDIFPQFVSVQFWQSWALGNNVTLLAANIQIPGYYAVGSGIFDGEDGAIAYTFNPDGVSKLVVANVPRDGHRHVSVSPDASITAVNLTDAWDYKDDGKDVPMDCSKKLLNDSVDIYTDYRCLEAKLDNYTFVKLTDPSGRVKACNNGMCCSVEYSTSGFAGDHFYLGVFNGTYNSFDRYFWCEEDCVLARCDAHGDIPCGLFPMQSSTVFHEVHLTANFTTEIVYPQVVASGVRLVPLRDWHLHSHDHQHHDGSVLEEGERCVHYENVAGESLISVGMKGRCYERDPPYVR